MKRSINEITNELRKALIGAGYPVGVAQDGAGAAVCLLLAGFDGVAAAAAALPEGGAATLSDSLPNLLAIHECVLAGEDCGGLDLADTPMLALGISLHLANQHDCSFTVELNGAVHTITPTGIDPAPDEVALANMAPAFFISGCGKADKSRGRLSARSEGFEINEALWPVIQRWSKETYVPASEQSRLSGAGAGLNDND